ncbi:unnamed protein product [Owenia fusiformis]|uniref:Uncharacterized protein n=1 Tax=Owenia fusiformis TaxID=6347 RepID=A0A8J1TT94_OWEFU|nr:unnamed protein product [Owenia fusiformis]
MARDGIHLSENNTAKLLPGLGNDHKYHVMISYTKEDANLVNLICKLLEPLEPKILCVEDGVIVGKAEDVAKADDLNKVIEQSLCLLVICSENFSESKWAQYIACQGIQKMMSAVKPSPFIQIVKCNIAYNKMPTYLSWLTYIESKPNNDEDFKKKITWAVAGETARSIDLFGGL